ncbi:MAG: pantoate--beta-alanine ligase [Chitinophagaceae bacterium]|nr:pantoate--beta-alanine ligase [Chitinophagaceae bacterium]
MILIRKASFLNNHIARQRGNGLTTGFVPTMGALHDAHISLINHSASVCDVTVCSIFVNPTQFNDPNDYNKYPDRLENDLRMLSNTRVSVIFVPPVYEIYSEGTTGLEHYDLGYLETILEGKFRPGHFQGVCQVMSRLLKAVQPDRLFMGQKDYQQCMVVKKLLSLLNMDTSLEALPTLRDTDGLAMSSRNLRLTAEQRAKAPLIFQVLTEIKSKLAPGNLDQLKHDATKRLDSGGFKVEYVEIANAENLHPVSNWNGNTPLVALVAAFMGEVRLIDNMLLNN